MSSSIDSGLDILVSGIGIAGPVVSYFLLRGNPNHRITLLERSDDLRTSGQSIDVRQRAVDILKYMDVLEKVKGHTTGETGIRFVDDNGKELATFMSSGDESKQSFTSEYEIMRGDLVEILFETVKDRIKVVYGDYIIDLKQDEDERSGKKVEVEYKNGKLEKKEWDLVIACDGQRSKIRNIILNTVEDPYKHYRSFNQIAAYFSMPRPSKGMEIDDLAYWYNDTNGRVIFLRPDNDKTMIRANIIRQLTYSESHKSEVHKYREALQDNEVLKKVFREDLEGAGWITKEILEGMDNSTDMYASETAQIRAPHLAINRVALVGDAGYGPTQLTGMGTSLAMIGAFILAGEITNAARSGQSVKKGLENYDKIMLPFARKIQNIPQSLPQYVNPQSGWGLSLQRTVIWFVGLTRILDLVAWFSGLVSFGKGDEPLPIYDWDAEERKY